MFEANMVFVTLLVIVLSNNYADGVEMWNFNSQNKYQIIVERLEIFRKNDIILSEGKAKSFKYNRTVIGFDMDYTFNVDVNTWKGFAVFYKFSVNEYKRTAIQTSFDFCDSLKYNYLGFGTMLKVNGNFSDCPLPKGKYVVRNATVDGRRFPPNFPEGRGMLNITGFINGKEAYILNSYSEIKYFVRRRKH